MAFRLETVPCLNHEVRAPQPLTFLHWNVRNTSSPEDIIGHLQTVQDTHGELGIMTLLEVPIPLDSTKPTIEIAEQIAEAYEMPYVHFTPRAYHSGHRLRKSEPTVLDGMAILSKFPFMEASCNNIVLAEYDGGIDLYRERLEFPQLLVASVQVPGRPNPLSVGTTHLSTFTRGRSARRNEVQVVIEQAQHLDVLSLDANARTNTARMRALAASLPRIDDNRANTYIYTHGQFSAPVPGASRRIDFIHLGPDSEISAKGLHVWPDPGPSDHRPLIAELGV